MGSQRLKIAQYISMPIQQQTQHSNRPISFLEVNWFKIVIVLAIAYGFYYLNEKSDRNTKALQDTLIQMKTLADGTVIMRGNIETAAQLEKQAREQMGKDFMAQVSATNGTVTALHTLIGQLAASVIAINKVNGEKRANGSFTAILEQDRGKDKASLTAIDLRYDATKSNLTDAFAGSSWKNNREDFKIQFGEWRTDKDGIRSAATLKREIYRSDNTKLGEEAIPIINADAYYSKDNIERLTSPPKYNFILGTIHDATTGRNGPILQLDTKITRQLGITTGMSIIGNQKNYMLGTSWSFGKLNN